MYPAVVPQIPLVQVGVRLVLENCWFVLLGSEENLLDLALVEV